MASAVEQGRLRGLALLLCAGCVVVPSVFTTRIEAVFVVPKLAALWVLLALGFVLLAVDVLRFGAPAIPGGAGAVDLAVACFVALNLAAWAGSIDRPQSLYGERYQYQGLLTLLLCVGFYVLARFALSDARRLRLLAVSVTAGGTLVAGYALVQRAGLDPIWKGFLPGGRVFSSIGLSNALAAYLVLVVPVAAALALVTAGRRRRLLLLALAMLVAAFAFTLSRGGLLGLVAAAAVLAVGLRLLGVWSRGVTVALATMLAAIAAVVVAVAPERLAFDFDTDLSLGFHLDAWRVAAHVAADHPWLGTGQETFPDVFPSYSHELLSAERAAELDLFRVESPHNVYLGLAAGSGVPALAAYLAILGTFAVATVRALRNAPLDLRVLLVGVLAATAGHVVTDAFMSPELTGTWLFWLLLGATLGALPDRPLGPRRPESPIDTSQRTRA